MTQGTTASMMQRDESSFADVKKNVSSSSSSKFSWKTLSRSVMELDEKNYAHQSTAIVIELESLLVADADCSKNIAVSVMYILYERALRELVTSSFPLSASIIESLGSSTDIIDTFQTLTRTHVQDLLKKLEKLSPLTYNNVGIMFSLLSLHRLNQMGGKKSELTKIFDMTIDSTLNYIKSFSDANAINLLMLLLYALVTYALNDAKLDERTVRLVNFMRGALIKHGDVISNFTKVLILDIMERLQNNKPTQLYEAIYQKIFQPDIFIIPGLNKFISNVSYPCGNNDNGAREQKSILSINDEATVSDEKILRRQSTSTSNDSIDFDEKVLERSISVDLDFTANTAAESTSFGNNVNKKTREVSTFNVENHIGVNEKTGETGELVKSDSVVDGISATNSVISVTSSPELKPPLKWSISQMQDPVVEEKITEILEVPENCIGRVVGFQGAIARKLELESNAVIEVCNPVESPRPDTSCLTAHKLVTGSLGVPMQMAPEQIEEEKLKLSNAKVRRLTEERGEQMRVINISGNEKEINEAVRLIKDIIICGVTIHIYLDFTVDEIVHKYSGKLKTIELLLNIHLEVEELENQKVVLNISGDKQSCQDAKKLIFDEIGSFRSQHGHLFFIPEETMSVLKDESGVKQLVRTVQIITSARILSLSSDEGYAIFISGYQHQVNRSLQIFQKVNADVMCCLSDTTDGENDLNTHDVCQFVKESYKRGSRGENRSRPTLSKKKIVCGENEGRLIYSKEKLLELSKLKLAQIFPESLVLLDDPEVKDIILYECDKMCCIAGGGHR